MARRTADDDVSRHFLAKVLGVDVRSVTNYANEGMPRAERGQYPLARCVQWFVNREREAVRKGDGPSELDLARQRKTIAEARKAEMEAESLEGTLLPVSVFEAQLGVACDRLRGVLMGVPSKYLGPILAARTDAEAQGVGEAIRDETLRALQETADDDDEPDDRSDEPSARHRAA